MDLPAGALLGGRYIVETVLGRGGFATVYAARHAQLGSHHAVKVLHAGVDEDHRGRMLGEGRIQARLSHKNVVRVTDVVELPDGVALVMDRVEGETLRALLDRGPPALPVARALADGLLEGVAAAHAAGLVHRDLKPDNVLVGTDGTPRVTDFGLARADDPRLRGAHTKAGIGMGTPGYMAPEAYTDVASVDARADVFALGAILYELLSGQRASPGAHPWFVHYQRASNGEFAPLDTVVADLPSHLVEAVHAALDPLPDARPGSVAALAEIWRGAVSAPSPASATDTAPAAASPEDAAPTLVPASALVLHPRHNIPAERDAFVGREADLAQLAQRLERARLVTVLGPGGTGKTRLVTRFAWDRSAGWPGGVTFCDLADARTLEGVVHAVASALDVPLAKEDPVVQLGNAIRGRGRCLVLLDNFEQLTACAEATLGHWLQRAPEARFVVTSRERLGVPGEAILQLDALDTESAVALFALRAAAQDLAFTLGPDNHDDVVAIVETLDRLPLAIELAAARVRLLPPARLRERLRDRFKILASSKGVVSRQSTLRATIDWSWDLLTPWERAALAQCSVFSGGFGLEAAEAVLDLSPWPDAPLAMDAIGVLLDKSLLRSLPESSASSRLGLFATIQEYASEKLSAPGAFDGSGPALLQATEIRHGRYFASLGSDAAVEALYASRGGVRSVAPDVDNYVVAGQRAVRRGDGPVAAGAARAAWVVLERTGPATAAVQLAEAVLSLPALSGEDMARTLAWSGKALLAAGQVEQALARLAAAVARSVAVGARAPEIYATAETGIALSKLGRLPEARASCEAALLMAEASANGRAVCTVLAYLGNINLMLGDHVAARARFAAALERARALGDRHLEAWMLNHLAGVTCDQGDLAHGLTYATAALSLAQEVGERPVELRALGALGYICLMEGRPDDARRHIQGALAIARGVGERRAEAFWLQQLGGVSRAQGRAESAERELRGAVAMSRELGDPLWTANSLVALSEVLSDTGRHAEAQTLLEEGLALLRQTGADFSLALSLCAAARCAARAGRPGAAALAFAEAAALAESMQTAPTSELGVALDALRGELGLGAAGGS